MQLNDYRIHYARRYVRESHHDEPQLWTHRRVVDTLLLGHNDAAAADYLSGLFARDLDDPEVFDLPAYKNRYDW